MKKTNNKKTFYEVFHKNVSVGFFTNKKMAEEYAKGFNEEIGGYLYPIKILGREFLDGKVEIKKAKRAL